MSKRRVFATLSVSLLLAACGGGGDNNELSREYGMMLQVDGSMNISDKTLTQRTLTRENYDSRLEVCVRDRIRTDGTEVSVPEYDNYEEIGEESSDYCDGEREHVARGLAFQARFINNTYDPLPISYKGVGIEIRIYKVDSVDAEDGDEVWNSIIAQDLGNRISGGEPFDPYAEHSITLKAGQSFPSQSNFAIGYTFNGDSNYRQGASPDVYDFDANFVGLGWDDGDCTLEQVAGTTGWDPLDATRTRPYNKPLCQTRPLDPGLYRVKIDFSFTPAIDPVMFHVTLEEEP